MTRQEAVEVIKDFVAYGKRINAFVYKGSTAIPIEALNMAIAALEQEETLKNLTKPNKSDLISRQAAIDALAKFVPYAICDESTESYTNGLTDAYNLICQLPSAQPERKKGNEKCSNELPCGWCSLFDAPCFGRGDDNHE